MSEMISDSTKESEQHSDKQEDVATEVNTPDPYAVLYNIEYGGFEFSKVLMKEYKQRTGVELDEDGDGIARDDPILCKVVQDVGCKKASGKYASLAFAMIHPRFKKHWFIKEYDGAESVHIDFERYRVDTIKEILQDPELNGPVFDKLRSVAHENLNCDIKQKIW